MDLFNYNMPDRSSLPFPFDYSTCGSLSTGFGLSPDGSVNSCSFMAHLDDFKGPNLAAAKVTVYDAWLHPNMERIRKARKIGCEPCDYYKQQCEGKCTAMVIAEGGRIEDGKLIGRDRYCFMPFMKDEKNN
jgi:radical SAM protein with 4Fe4S-binding SPASM domain